MIRHANADDLDTIAALHLAARATYYRGHVPEEEYAGPEELARTRAAWSGAVGRGQVLCAERDGEVAGVAAYRPVDGVMTLTQLHVRPDRWRRGVGAELHAACLEAWRAEGVTTARLQVFDRNERAKAFYAAHGWTPDTGAPRSGTHLVLRLTVEPATE
ncbi:MULTISPECIES: GNAT family N-acetyltransferase [Streptomyces]|uniref:GNAT family N-acetyltransferase n=1 Tax=Streptomyces TaxID=1883 RepID=UPI0013185C02|nr:MULTISPECIES: GNAT family N-acetyltransferase [Streptomyces]QGZ48331.1 GNAT family N-acetyltransferase [Streptomyces sp. QHH-9511]GGT66143.1 N-acetyltransferase [Streptomyces lateritius]